MNDKITFPKITFPCGIADAAEYLDITVSTVRYHIYTARALKPLTIGKTLVFTKEILDDFNQSRREPGRPKKGV